jgi:uncharacterized lipoprotein YajG
MKLNNNTLLAVCALVLLAGCQTPQKAKTPPITSKVSENLNNLDQELSRADGKAVLIQKWLEANN